MSEKKKSNLIKKIGKWFIYVILLLVAIIVGAGYYFYNYYNWQGAVRRLVHQYGTQAVGTDVNIGNIDLSLTNGHGSVGNITVANPKGYSQDNIIKLENIAVAVDVDSVKKIVKELAQNSGSKTKTVVINEIKITKPEVSYELMNLNRTNAADILNNIQKNTSAQAKTEEKAATKASDTTYNVAIKKVTVANGTATVAANMLGASQSLSLNLPTITISNLGTEKQGITIEEGLARIFQEILKTTTNVASKADLSKILGGVDGLKNAAVSNAANMANTAAGGAGKAAENVGNSVKGIANGVGGLFK
ncbi:MAG: hypothetical protein IJ099_00595 [Alphaproteobacteria bacterium]|nr:hypothetical protein [Alphaproteobacteria bacterium]